MILEKRRLKALKDAAPKYKYLLETVGTLIKAFKSGE